MPSSSSACLLDLLVFFFLSEPDFTDFGCCFVGIREELVCDFFLENKKMH